MDLGLRLTISASACLLPLVPLGLRLTDLQVLRHGSLQSRAQSEFARVVQEAAPRAEILDRDGRVLAQSVPSWSCFVDKAMVKDPAAFGARLAPLLGLPARALAAKARGSGRFAWLKKGLSASQADALRRARVRGVGVVPIQRRVYPNGDLARGVLGLVGTDGRGLAGVELTLDSRLRGTPGRFDLIRDGAGRTIYKRVAEDGSTPPPVRLTIDRDVQYLAEKALRDGAARSRFESGDVVVEDPATGEILAMASWPPTPLKNPSVQDAYEPGSTFKIVTALAALDSGLVTPTQTFNAENGRWEIVPGVVITDVERESRLTLEQILEKSSNIGISKVSALLGAVPFYRMCRVFGFGARTGISLPGETAGDLKPLSDLTKVGLASASYGYGQQVSPLQVVSAYSAIADGGILREPKLVLDGRAPVEVRRVASTAAVDELQRMLEGVVEQGTGTTARIPGYRIAGKTGTARQIDPETHRYSATDYTASFVGFLPVSKPRWTILVVLNAPRSSYYGAQTAGPIFRELASRLLVLDAVPPDAPVDAELAAARR
ncbi:MAG: penicillin-binding protein 2 [Elusimicrobia bacterium]|nr:penicillin-binding protein 2 [Elusimicrobiota bacterium]